MTLFALSSATAATSSAVRLSCPSSSRSASASALSSARAARSSDSSNRSSGGGGSRVFFALRAAPGKAAQSCASIACSSVAMSCCGSVSAAAAASGAADGRGSSRCTACDRSRFSYASRAAASAARRFSRSTASSSNSASIGSSSGKSGISTWYSFFGAGSELKPSRSSRLSSDCCARSEPTPPELRLSASLMLSPSRKGVARGVAPPVIPPILSGVSPTRGVASGLGVAATRCRGVTPEKSLGLSSGFSPPTSGVCVEFIRKRFCASRRMASPPPPPAAGVRIGVRIGVCDGVCWYVGSNPCVTAEPPAAIASRSEASTSPDAPILATSSSSRSDTCGDGSMSLERLRTAIPDSLMAFTCATADGASCRSRIFWRFESRFMSASSMSSRRFPSMSSTVTGLKFCSAIGSATCRSEEVS
mmetsp:Transcript_7720/g.25603  ORF Transcript_7720/g.25603 Transcript_7720/m.25603 type:complete len:419 (+) Transcript_7720:508-1764(+)